MIVVPCTKSNHNNILLRICRSGCTWAWRKLLGKWECGDYRL